MEHAKAMASVPAMPAMKVKRVTNAPFSITNRIGMKRNCCVARVMLPAMQTLAAPELDHKAAEYVNWAGQCNRTMVAASTSTNVPWKRIPANQTSFASTTMAHSNAYVNICHTYICRTYTLGIYTFY